MDVANGWMTMNDWVSKYQHWFSLLGLVVGIFGTCFGLYNWVLRREIVRMRENVLFSVLAVLKRCRRTAKDSGASERVNDAMITAHDNLISYIDLVLRLNTHDIDSLQRKDVLELSDVDYLQKIGPRRR